MLNIVLLVFTLLTGSFNAVATPAAVLAPKNPIQVCAIVVADIVVGSPSAQTDFPVDPVKGISALQKLAVRIVGSIVVFALIIVIGRQIANPPVQWITVIMEGVGVLFLGAIVVKIDAVTRWFNSLF